MQQYAIRAMSGEPFGIPEHNIALDTGFNVFNVVTEDLDQILSQLRSHGVQILDIQMMQQPRQTLEDLLVPGEPLEVLCVPTGISAQRIKASTKA